MKIIFFGTGNFAIPTLSKLFSSTNDILAVVTQPDKKKGRGYTLGPTPVKDFVKKTSPKTKIFQPKKVSEKGTIKILSKLEADIFVVVDYGQKLSEEVLNLPKKYCINLHPSLLPKYRGASPVNYSILNGDSETGVTVIKMNEKMDAGDIILQEKTKIEKEENSIDLFTRLSKLGADLIVKTLDLMEKNKETLTPQNEKDSSYAHRLKKDDGKIDWKLPAEEIIRKVKGLKPWPGAFTFLGRKKLQIIEGSLSKEDENKHPAGTILSAKDVTVSTGRGAIKIKTLQLAGKKAMSAEEFLRGYKLEEGTILG